MKESLFYGKILLFGEYGVIQDSMGLSVPYDYYKGTLTFESDDTELKEMSNGSLKKYLSYLKDLRTQKDNLVELDLKTFEEDIDNGLLFDSTIPQGFGVGSSGALVAAVYDQYAINKIGENSVSNDQILELKKIFSQMENYFHGKSSGLDPLICYLNLPILIKSQDELESPQVPASSTDGKGAIFLLNTGNPGKTEPMVNIFMEKLKQKGFRKVMKEEFKKYNDACIEAFLNKDFQPLLSNMKQLSTVLFDHFRPMIPDVFHKFWKEGIETDSYYLKLCGSGGGGFIIGFTKDIELAKEKLKSHQLDVIYQF
ncbi:MAG: mevalonate kinase [Flavobacteriales bacterium]|nr:mevalonate kinase [Flavobacteriales bacterium]